MRDADERKVVFDADPSPDVEITSQAIDPEVPLGIMDEGGNIAPNPTEVARTIGISGQKATPEERIIDAGHAEKRITDVRELVGFLFLSQVVFTTFV